MGVYCIPSLKRGIKSNPTHPKALAVPAAAARAGSPRAAPLAAAGAPAGKGVDLSVNKDVDQGPGVQDSVLLSRYLRQGSGGGAKMIAGEVNAAQQEALLREQQDKEACIHLYQVLAQALLGRAAVFGNHLELPVGATCTGLPYYCAPAAAAMPLQPVTVSATGSVHAGQAYGSAADMQPMASGGAPGALRDPNSDPITALNLSTGGGSGAGDVGRGSSALPPVAGSTWNRPPSNSSSRVMSATRSFASGLMLRRPKGSAGVPSVTFVFCAVEGIKPLKHAV